MMDQRHRVLLVVEDSDEDFELTRWALERAGFDRPILRATRVEDALRIMHPPEPPPRAKGTGPCAVLLDLNLPDGSGLEFLEALRADPGYLSAPTVVITTSSNPRDIERCYRLGAAGYFIKPLDRGMLEEQIQAFVRYWFRAAALPAA